MANMYRIKIDPDCVLLHFGETSPDPRYLAHNIKEMEELAWFSGTIVHLQDLTMQPPASCGPDQYHYLTWHGPYPGGSLKLSTPCFPPSYTWQVSPTNWSSSFSSIRETFLNDLQAANAKAKRFRRNFLHFSPQDLPDFNDDWSGCLNNVEALARFAQAAGLKGIFFDQEPMGWRYWSWTFLKDANTLDLANSRCQAGIRECTIDQQLRDYEALCDHTFDKGKRFIQAINAGYPGCIVWLTHGYSDIQMEDQWNNFPRVNGKSRLMGEKGLMGVFLDGIIEGSDKDTIIIDGSERTYGAYPGNEDRWPLVIRRVTQQALAYTSASEDMYKNKMRLGFAFNTSRTLKEYCRGNDAHCENDVDSRDAAENLDIGLAKTLEWFDDPRVRTLNQGKRFIWFWHAQTNTWWLPPLYPEGSGRTRFSQAPLDRVYQKPDRGEQPYPNEPEFGPYLPYSRAERFVLAKYNPALPQGSGVQSVFLVFGKVKAGDGIVEIKGLPRDTRVVHGTVVLLGLDGGRMHPTPDTQTGGSSLAVYTKATQLYMHGDEPVCYIAFNTTADDRGLGVMLTYGPG